ncbi:MAG: glycosyltransferase family 4 protein [Candidatus Aminicenantales bacterium]
MRIAALLPHVEVFGGVRRFLEIGNELTQRGHLFTLFTPKGKRPEWIEFKGILRPFEALAEERFDIGLCSEYSILAHFDRLEAKAKFFYFVLEGHKREREVVKRDYHFLGCSEGISQRIEKKYGLRCFRAVGGVNPDIFYPWPKSKDEATKRSPDRQGPKGLFTILSYGRIYKKRKGIRNVIKAVEKVYKEFPEVRLIFFDTLVGDDRRDPRPLVRTFVPFQFYLNLPQSRMAWLFSRADLFVSAERRAGWANTVAEAMACALPVVTTASGTKDFAFHERTALVVPLAHPFFLYREIKRLIEDPGLRARLALAGYEKIKEFTWAALAKRLEEIFSSVLE